MGMQELIVGLVVGSYGFTWACYRMLATRIDTLINNHLKHLKKPEEE